MSPRLTGGQAGLVRHPLTQIRLDRNWTLQDLVDVLQKRLNTAARREKAWRWENREVVPDDATQRALATELGVPERLVRILGWPCWLPTGDRITIDLPWTAEGSLAGLDETAGHAMTDRRSFLILAGGTAVSLADQWLTQRAPQLASILGGGRVDAGLVSCFERRLPDLRQMDATLGGGSVRAVVDSELRLVADLLANGTYSEAVGRRMFALAAELGRIAGFASFDAGFHAAAERYWTAALRAAHAADDRAQGANILKCMSLQRVDTDRPDEALALATAAREGAKGAPPRVVAMLTVRQARTHAVRGERIECERLLLEADGVMAKSDEQPAPAWAGYFDQAEYCAQVAACYLLLRRHQATDHWLSQSLALQPDERSRDRATYLIWRADSVMSLGDVEHACALVSQAVPDIAAARSSRNHRRLADIHARLRQHRTAAVDALDEQVRALIA